VSRWEQAVERNGGQRRRKNTGAEYESGEGTRRSALPGLCQDPSDLKEMEASVAYVCIERERCEERGALYVVYGGLMVNMLCRE
jgi:hypothetical protein